MTQTANHMMKVATDVYYSANGKVRVAKIDRVWIVGKQNDGDRFFAAMAGFSTVREALVFAEGVETAEQAKATVDYEAYIESKYGKIPTITEYFAEGVEA